MVLPVPPDTMQAAGRPATAVQWGAWGGGGMAARVPGFAARMERTGLGLLPPEAGLSVLAAVLAGAAAPVRGRLQQPVVIGAQSPKTSTAGQRLAPQRDCSHHLPAHLCECVLMRVDGICSSSVC